MIEERNLIGLDLELAEALEQLVRIRLIGDSNSSSGKGIHVVSSNLAFLSTVDPSTRRPHTRSDLYDTRLTISYHLVNGGQVDEVKHRAYVPVVVKAVGRVNTPLRPTECPALSSSGAVMRLLQEDKVNGHPKLAYLKSPFLLLGTDKSQIMEKIEGETLDGILKKVNHEIKCKVKDGRSTQDETAFLIETLRKAFAMDAELVQHLTLYQENIPSIDGRGDLIDPEKERDYLKTLLWGSPTDHGEQGYIPIMLDRAKRLNLITEGQLEGLLTLKEPLMDTRGMRKVKRAINQIHRRRAGRKKVLPHGDLEPGNIIEGYETSLVLPGLEFRDTRVKEYRPIDFGRTRYWNLGKDPVSLFSDSSYQPLWNLTDPNHFGFVSPWEEFNRVVKKVTEGIPAEYALDPVSKEEWNASLFLHAASRSAKRMCRLRNEGLDVEVEETMGRGMEEVEKRLDLTRSVHQYSSFFLQACKELGVCGARGEELANILFALHCRDEETVNRLAEVYNSQR